MHDTEVEVAASLTIPLERKDCTLSYSCLSPVCGSEGGEFQIHATRKIEMESTKGSTWIQMQLERQK
jgi:hypothetical protein